MLMIQNYSSPVGKLILAQKEDALVGCWIEGQKHQWGRFQNDKKKLESTDLLEKTKQWLDLYFQGQMPKLSNLPMDPEGTDFQIRVWHALCQIPYGQTLTYGQLARQLNVNSAQAIGQAVGHNPISILIPCHRVISSKHTLCGYAGGLDVKAWLLSHEGVCL